MDLPETLQVIGMYRRILITLGCFLLGGCSLFPDVSHQPLFHNPFPQLHVIAVLPFFNQSSDPTLDQDQVAIAYYNELQAIPGFEVLPVGVSKLRLQEYLARQQAEAGGDATKLPPIDFQELARFMEVDAVVLGSVTEYSPYYPPRVGMTVRWYAANPSFHPIPAGYGLPWGTAEEEFIPDSLVFEAEFALAKEQLKTQTPTLPAMRTAVGSGVIAATDSEPTDETTQQELPSARPDSTPELLPPAVVAQPGIPADWPDPRGFVPSPPTVVPAPARPQDGPVMSLTRLYHGDDNELTRRLASYAYFRDDARFGGWQTYLKRSDDFMRFCCHLHVTEMLASRGGAGKTRVVWRWPIDR